MISTLDHLNLNVPNYDATLTWYQTVLGFEVVESGIHLGAPWSILRAGNAMLCMYAVDETSTHHQTLNHIGLRITDRQALEAALSKHQVPVRYGGPYRFPHSTAFYVQDPAGNELELAVWDDDVVRFGT